MKFWEAMALHSEGKKVRMTHWDKHVHLLEDDYDEERDGEWELFIDNPLNWEEVAAGLERGKKYRRTSWDRDVYLWVNSYNNIYIFEGDRDRPCEVWRANIEDFFADDWEEVK